jgi:methyl-accepting chemotaxis protein
MKASSNGYTHTPTAQYIQELAAQVERDPTDLVQKIALANALEQTGEIAASVALYQQIIEQDRDGNYGLVARKALESLKNSSMPQTSRYIGATSSLTQSKTISDITPTSHQHQRQGFLSAFRQLRHGWKNLNFRTKLTILLVAGTAIPVIIVTQGIVAVTKESLFLKFKQSLQREGMYFREDYVTWNVDESRTEAQTIANFVQTVQIDLSNPQQTAASRKLLQNYISNFRVSQESNSLEKNIRILTDAQGRTVAQNIQTLAEESFNFPAEKLQLTPRYRQVSLPVGIYLGDIPIVKNALSTGKELGGMELLKSDVLKRLAQDKQANIGLQAQRNEGLPTSEQPFPDGTYDIDGGQAALVPMVVKPIKIGNKLVGTAIVGTIENRSSITVDAFKARVNVPIASVYALDWRIISNIPAANGKRDIGTRAPRSVAEIVLNQGQEYIDLTKIAGANYLGVYQPLYDHQQELNATIAKPVGMTFVARPIAELDSLLALQQIAAYGIGLVMSLIAGVLAIIIAGSFARPLGRLADFASFIGNGKQGIRLEDDQRQDEIGILTHNLNAMAAKIEADLQAVRQREILQRREKERLQQGMINLLLETETAKDGDLTVRAKVNQGETGAIADAFNSIISSLQQLVIKVSSATKSVQSSAIDSEASVEKLSHEATNQADVVTEALTSVEQMERSIGAIAKSAQTAAEIAHQALQAATDGDRDMDRTVGSIETLRTSVAATTKKAKKLAESAQEISKIVSIISGISEKTNLLAFNAAIEASKAGEHGKGFRQVANEVRRLAERVTESTKEIEQLVTSIQQGTSDVLKTMEVSFAEVATGTQLVANTKQNLQSLAAVSQQIDSLLQSISVSTVSQAENSKMVNSTMQAVSAIAQTTKVESEAVLSAMQELLEVAQQLQNSVSRFRV